MGSDVETGTAGTELSAFGDKAIRLAFIRKVYGILSVQLMVTFAPVLGVTVYRSVSKATL